MTSHTTLMFRAERRSSSRAFWVKARAEEGRTGTIDRNVFPRELRVASAKAKNHAYAPRGSGRGTLCGQGRLAGVRGVCSGPEHMVDCPACLMLMALSSLSFLAPPVLPSKCVTIDACMQAWFCACYFHTDHGSIRDIDERPVEYPSPRRRGCILALLACPVVAE